jgi:hypothetical protein
MKQDAELPQIRLEFGFSTSPSYERAVSIARGLSSYVTWGEGRALKHQVTFAAEEVEEFLQLALLVRKWKSAIFWVDGKGYNEWTPLRHLHCIRERVTAYEPDAYCGQDNYWGCRQVTNSLRTGEVDKSGVFHFDKDRFRFEQKKELDLLETCPFFDRELVLQRLDELDKVIDPRTSEDWDYYTGLSDTVVGVYYVLRAEEVEFPTLEERGEKAWHTRIISIPDGQWVKYAAQGRIPEVDVLVEQGWRLIAVIARDEMWYCVLERF